MDDTSTLARFARDHAQKLRTSSPMAPHKRDAPIEAAAHSRGPRLTQPERALWRDVYIATLSAILQTGRDSSVETVADTCAAHADEAVNRHRHRITWTLNPRGRNLYESMV